MPIYEYGCRSCGHELEVQQRFSDPPLATCPSCGKDALERLISLTSFQLKGGGWYRDGYGSSKPASSTASKSDGSSGKGSGSSGGPSSAAA